MTTNRLLLPMAAAAATTLILAGCGGGGFDDEGSPTSEAPAGDSADAGSLTVLIGSSGDAETTAVQDAAKSWSDSSGVQVDVQVAADLNQQLSQGFAANQPPDLFYLSSDQVAAYAGNESIAPYFEQLSNAGDFYPNLVDAFTVDGTPYCAPKDFSTLALVINTDMWKEAGLSDADVPATWAELEEVASQLSTDDRAGLSFTPEWQRIGVFMAQAGGALMNADSTEATVDSPENIEGLEFTKKLLTEGAAQFASDLGAGWGGEAFGIEGAAMVIEGNWIVGAMSNDYPDIAYQVVELPAGKEQGTLLFTNCWGIAADGNVDDAVSFVEFLTSDDQQMAFATAFGVMPSVETVRDQWAEEFPDQKAFIDGADYAQSGPTIQGASDVIADFNSQLQGLASANPEDILESVQTNLQALVK